LSEEGLVRAFMESIRSNVKEVIKEFGWPLTHKGWWNIVKVMKAFETLPIPKLSKLL